MTRAPTPSQPTRNLPTPSRSTPNSPTPSRPSPRLRWTGAVGAGLHALLLRRAMFLRDAESARRGAATRQAQTLRWLLRRAAGTEYGRAHGFAQAAAESEPRRMLARYREATPIVDWYALRAPIERMREGGEAGVLWPGLVRHFAQTSGTTAGDKFIPVSREMFRSNYRASLDIFAHLMNRGVSLPALMSGRCLFLGGSSDLKPNAHGIVTADLSGLVTPMIRWPISAVYSPGREVALIDHWPTKIERMAALALSQDIRMISGMPSWAGVLLDRVLELARASGRRAERLLDVWPNLGVFVHGGVRYGPFQRRLAQLLTGDPAQDFAHRLELYPASEAFVAMQDRPGDPGLRLCDDHGNFFEFVPAEEVRDDGTIAPDAPAFAAWEVERGVRYVVVLSTCAGLWRYVLGDVVEFDDVPDRAAALRGPGPAGSGPPRVRIVGRHRHFVNAFGENLIVEHIEDAVAAAALACGAAAESATGQTGGLVVGEFTAAPVYPGPGRRAGLELVIEMPPGVSAGVVRAFGEAFDAALQRANVDYTTKRRDDLGMGPPTVTPVPPGTMHAWMASRGKLGGQHKCPRCANHRDFVDALRQARGLAAWPAGAEAAAGVP